MRCSRVRKMLMAYFDGELSASDAGIVSGHCLICPDCAKELEGFRRADAAVTVPNPGAGYWDSLSSRVMDRVRDEARTGSQVVPIMKKEDRFHRFLRFAPAFSLAVVLLVGTGIFMENRLSIIGTRPRPVTEEIIALTKEFDDRGVPAGIFASQEGYDEKLSSGKRENAQGRFRTPAEASDTIRPASVLDILNTNLAGGELVLIQVLNIRPDGDVIELKALKTDLDRSGLVERSVKLRDAIAPVGDDELTQLLEDLVSALRGLHEAPPEDLPVIQERIRKSGILQRASEYRVILAGGGKRL